jgi:hypothetical protein
MRYDEATRRRRGVRREAGPPFLGGCRQDHVGDGGIVQLLGNLYLVLCTTEALRCLQCGAGRVDTHVGLDRRRLPGGRTTGRLERLVARLTAAGHVTAGGRERECVCVCEREREGTGIAGEGERGG